MSPVSVDGVRVGFDGRVVLDDVSIDAAAGAVTVVVGPNGCGKSTLLRTMGRLIRPDRGTVSVGGFDVHRVPTREVARIVGFLPQSPLAPPGMTVRELVGRGRAPHQGLFRSWTGSDEAAVGAAMERCDVADLADRRVDELSGGQRQRVWIAMVLAQETDVLLLDEPTTYLDVAHQLDVLELVASLRGDGRTVVAVLHDLNLACRYADRLVVMCGGRVLADGAPARVVDEPLLRAAFDLDADLVADPTGGPPVVVPRRRRSQPCN